MTKPSNLDAAAGTPAAVISHIFLRLRGRQSADTTVLHAGTELATVTLSWGGGTLMRFCNAEAIAGVLEAFSAARATLMYLPANAPAAPREPYDQPSICIDWTRRPSYAVATRSALTPDRRHTLRWTDVYATPVTFQILDRTAFHTGVEVLGQAHAIAARVCGDGPRYGADPTRDDYRPPR